MRMLKFTPTEREVVITVPAHCQECARKIALALAQDFSETGRITLDLTCDDQEASEDAANT